MRSVRLFLSSPGDVDHERRRVDRVAERLNAEYVDIARIETIRWEIGFYSAHTDFQHQIPEAADCDIVVAIFWSRLGTELPPHFPRMPDGDAYPSGTAYEVLTAIRARETRPSPDIFVFRKNQRPHVAIDDEVELELARSQWGRLQSFFRRWFIMPGGQSLAAFQYFKTTDEFENKIEALLRKWLDEHVVSNRVSWPVEIKGSSGCTQR